MLFRSAKVFTAGKIPAVSCQPVSQAFDASTFFVVPISPAVAVPAGRDYISGAAACADALPSRTPAAAEEFKSLRCDYCGEPVANGGLIGFRGNRFCSKVCADKATEACD
mgnify:CR=1 FL=1